MNAAFRDEPGWNARALAKRIKAHPAYTVALKGSNSAGQNELCSSSETTQEKKIHWERQTFYLLTRALMGDPFSTKRQPRTAHYCRDLLERLHLDD